jgi:hypothetical protein
MKPPQDHPPSKEMILRVHLVPALGHKRLDAIKARTCNVSAIRLLDQPLAVQSFGDILETGRVSEEQINGWNN